MFDVPNEEPALPSRLLLRGADGHSVCDCIRKLSPLQGARQVSQQR